jgi:type II secretory pathway pseudopilin PulG
MLRNGFVKVKILILIAIVALIAFGILFAYLSSASSARDLQRIKDISLMSEALKIYFEENGFYPDGSSTEIPSGIETYVDRWPAAPVADGACSNLSNRYLYTQKLNGSDYALTFCLGSKTEGLSPGIHTLNPKGIK